MKFIDTVYEPFETRMGKLKIKMRSGLPEVTSSPEVILANLSTVSAVTTQGELPQNTQFGVPSRSKIDVINSNIDKSQAAKAAIIQKVALDASGAISDNEGLADYTSGSTIETSVKGGPSF